jgi:hypothetical protein
VFACRWRAGAVSCLKLEWLESRNLPSAALPDIAILSASLDTSTSVRFDDRASGNPGPFQVGLYRGDDAIFDSDDVQVGSLQTVTPATTGSGSGHFSLASEFPIDPAHKFVFVVADPNGLINESSKANNSAYFRILILGGVVHGLDFGSTPPAWEAQLAGVLHNDGYDRVIQFNWAILSHLPIPGATVIAGNKLATQVRLAAASMATRPGDVIDLHLIGHSRGTAVVSQAFLNLQHYPGPRALQNGFFKETLLDPHPARNSAPLFWAMLELAQNTGTSQIGGFSYNPASATSRAYAAATLAFQAVTQDPIPVVAANVDQSEVDYQQLAWNQTAPGSTDYLLGLNLQSQPPTAIVDHSPNPIQFVNLNSLALGHDDVPEWYLVNVAPTI